jgi:N-glycosylase/DNA lyase
MAFLCSSNKRIVQIRQICEDLANRLGEPIAGHRRALPAWSAVSEAGEEEIRACRTGYRARYLKGTADYLEAHPGCLNELDRLPHEQAVRALTDLPGVGSKVADCVLLFGAFRIDSFPVDTWIAKSMAESYGLHNWSPVQIAAFGRAHFGPYAGLAQQYLFADARSG